LRVPTRLAFGLISRTFYYVPVWAALEQGYFADEGLDVDLSIIGSGTQAAKLQSGELQITGAPPEGVVQDVEAGGSLTIIGGNSGRLSHFLITQPQFKRIEDLRGATLGILTFTEGSFFHFQPMMEKHGMRYPDDYKVLPTGGAPHRHQLLLEGKIDAGLQSIPWVYTAEEAGFNNLGNINDYIPDWQFNSFNADARWARENADTVVRFLRALLRGSEWMFTDRAGATALAAREIGIPLAHAERGWDYFISTGNITRDLEVNRPGLARVIESQIKAGLLPATLVPAPEKYITRGYLDAARASL
jgi:ABC-type nitrate/sulfonate/bicarbonate transport system substrate-binding protein